MIWKLMCPRPFCSVLLLGTFAWMSTQAEESSEAKPVKEKKMIISNATMASYIVERPIEFPKYSTQIINLANQNAQATRPRHVGQMSELIQEFPGRTYAEWEAWYLQKHPEAIDGATDKIMEMIARLQETSGKIDRAMVRQWVADLILTKTYLGLTYQEAILRTIAKKKDTTWRLATVEEEAKGIDGVIGDVAVSVKPTSYRSKAMLQEQIDVRIVYYEKVKPGLRVFYDF